MARTIVSSTVINMKLYLSPIQTNQPLLLTFSKNRVFQNGSHRTNFFKNNIPTRTGMPRTRAVLSEISNQKQYPKMGAKSTGHIPPNQLIQVVETAAKTGAEVVMDAVNRPRSISYKGLTDLVTETDKMSEAAILEVVLENFPDHLILGEEGGLIGDASSDYLWCIDPLDGTTNFAHCYPSFAVSVGVLFKGKPAAAAVVEFVGGPMCWNTRMFSATAGGGAFCNGKKVHVSQTDQVERSLLVTGFGYEHDDAWATNIDLFKEFTDISRGVRRLGAAAVDMCHVALGIVEAYWEYRLKPWDMAAGVLIVEEAGGTVTCMDGGQFCVFDRSVLVSNGVVHAKRNTEEGREGESGRRGEAYRGGRCRRKGRSKKGDVSDRHAAADSGANSIPEGKNPNGFGLRRERKRNFLTGGGAAARRKEGAGPVDQQRRAMANHSDGGSRGNPRQLHHGSTTGMPKQHRRHHGGGAS